MTGEIANAAFLSVQSSFLCGLLLATLERSWAAEVHGGIVYHWRYRRPALSAARNQFRQIVEYDACPADLSFAS
jgi:hypothetical protein